MFFAYPDFTVALQYNDSWGKKNRHLHAVTIPVLNGYCNKKNMETDVKSYIANAKPKEGPVAKTIEKQTAKLPSDLFLWAALSSMAVSLTFKLLKKDEEALFVGQWAAPFLLLGTYNKLVKLEGHDAETGPII
jgi:hypothetical protein